MRDYTPLDVLSDILMDVPELVFAYTHDGRYLFINGAAADFLNRNPLDVVGYHWRDLGCVEEVMGPLTERVAAVASTGRPEYYRLHTSPQKGLLTYDMSLTPIWSEEGNVLAVLAIGHDITEFFHPSSLS